MIIFYKLVFIRRIFTLVLVFGKRIFFRPLSHLISVKGLIMVNIRRAPHPTSQHLEMVNGGGSVGALVVQDVFTFLFFFNENR